MRGRRQAAKQNTDRPGHLVVGNKSYPLENIQVDIVTDNSPLQRKLPSNVKITPVTSEEPKMTRQTRVSLPSVPPKKIISKTNIPAKSPAVRSSPVNRPPPPVTRKSSVLNKEAWAATKQTARTSSLSTKPSGVSSVKNYTDKLATECSVSSVGETGELLQNS